MTQNNKTKEYLYTCKVYYEQAYESKSKTAEILNISPRTVQRHLSQMQSVYLDLKESNEQKLREEIQVIDDNRNLPVDLSVGITSFKSRGVEELTSGFIEILYKVQETIRDWGDNSEEAKRGRLHKDIVVAVLNNTPKMVQAIGGLELGSDKGKNTMADIMAKFSTK